MPAYQRDRVLPIDDVLARIRACITGSPSETIVSLTVTSGSAGETTVFRLSVQPDGSLVSLCAAECVPSSHQSTQLDPSTTPPSSSPQQTAQCEKSERSIDTAMDDEQRGADDLIGRLNESSGMDLDDDDGAEDQQPSTVEGAAASSSSKSSRADRVATPIAQPSTLSNNIRRSARQQQPPDRLSYTAGPPAVRKTRGDGATTATQAQVTKRGAKRRQRLASHLEAEGSTDSESAEASDSAWTSSSSSSSSSSSVPSRQQMKRHKKSHNNKVLIRSSSQCSDDSSDAEQVAALVLTLREANSRAQKEADIEGSSRQAVLQLVRDVLGDGAVQSGGEGADIDPVVYQRSATKLDLLISASTAMRMIGYYLRAVLAARLRRSHKSKYVRSARILLGLKSSADITAYPAFYAFVQQHCPSVASGVMDLDAWLQEPIFLADIGWAEWRRYLSKPQRWIIDSAIEQFQASLQPPRDWMQRGWVEEYDVPRLGRGVRAVCDIPLQSSMSMRGGDDSAIAADLGLLAQAQQQHSDTSSPSVPWYRFEWDGGKQQLDAEQLWVGRINHLPMPHCNLKLMGNGKLVQRRAIAAGEALTFDYGVQWWAHRVTGMTWNEWMTAGTIESRKGSADLFYRMHESVLDYTPLLAMEWDRRLDNAVSELERETVMMEMWEHVIERGQDGEVTA
jgi:hypothetical protein